MTQDNKILLAMFVALLSVLVPLGLVIVCILLGWY